MSAGGDTGDILGLGDVLLEVNSIYGRYVELRGPFILCLCWLV